MIHYTCDYCKRSLDPEHDLRYVVRIEIYPSLDDAGEGVDDDRDHLEEIQDILERLEDFAEEEVGDEVYQQLRFDLCTECRKKFLRDPIGRQLAAQLSFSKN